MYLEDTANRMDDLRFDSWFEVDETLAWITANERKRVALQLPDLLLKHAFRLSKRLSAKSAAPIDVFILADTSYGECCVDQTSASHNAADCVIHYGRSCLSRPTYLPTFLVFCDLGAELEISKATEFARQCEGKTVYVEMDVRYEGARKRIKDIFESQNVQVEFSPEPPRELIPLVKQPDLISSVSSVVFADYAVVLFVGPPRSPQIDRLAFTCATASSSLCEMFTWNVDTGEINKQEVTRALARRYMMVEKCRDASIIGILIGTMSVALFRDVLDKVTKAIDRSGRKSYSFVFGKLNPSKLANFPDVDCFVLVACQFNTLIDSKEFNKPIVTPYELEVALDLRGWGQYTWSFSDLLKELKTSSEDDKQPQEEQEQEVRMSLSTGKMLAVPKKRPDVSTITLRYESPAADSLAARTFRGLDPSTVHLTPTKATVGQVGVASKLYSLDDSLKEQPR